MYRDEEESGLGGTNGEPHDVPMRSTAEFHQTRNYEMQANQAAMPGGDDDDLFDDVEDEGHVQVAYGGETDGCTGEVPMERGENESHEDNDQLRVSNTQGDKPFTLFT